MQNSLGKSYTKSRGLYVTFMNQRGIKGVGFPESNFFSSSPTPARTATPPAGCGRGGRRWGRRRPGWRRRPAGLGSRVSGVGVGGGLHDRRAVEG